MSDRQKGLEMDQWMTFDEAWTEFYGDSDSLPSFEDKERARGIIAHFRSERFRVTVNYIRDYSNVVHVNKGFVVTKGPAPHVVPDNTYGGEGFTHRLRFTNTGSGTGGQKETPAPAVRVCSLCISEEHRTEECPDHPSNR